MNVMYIESSELQCKRFDRFQNPETFKMSESNRFPYRLIYLNLLINPFFFKFVFMCRFRLMRFYCFIRFIQLMNGNDGE